MIRVGWTGAYSGLRRGRPCMSAGVSRKIVFAKRMPVAFGEVDSELKRLIDEEYTLPPIYGSHKMVVHLVRYGHRVNSKRVQRSLHYLFLAGMALGWNISAAHLQHKVYHDEVHREPVSLGLLYKIQHQKGKLVRLKQGNVFDLEVELHQSPATFVQWMGQISSAENHELHCVPSVFAYGLMLFSGSVASLYKAIYYWFPDHESSPLWSTSAFAIKWPTYRESQLADRDAKGQVCADSDKCE